MQKMPKSIVLVLMIMFFQMLSADDQLSKVENKFKEYVNNVVEEVKLAETPDDKRAALNKSFDKMFKALDTVEEMPGLSQEETTFIASFREKFQDYSAELNGSNGYDPVPDAELNNFSEYVQQDLEQAEKSITLSLTSLLLIIIIVILLA